MSDTERFWNKVTTSVDGCWMWTGATDSKGYGRFSMGGSHKLDGSRRNSMVAAHRFSYELVNGSIPKTSAYHGMCVLHKCDTPGCVNPRHLFLGTNEDNVHDMDRKGRRINGQLSGSSHANSKLVESDVLLMLDMYRSSRVSQTELAKRFNVCSATVNHILNGRIWSHLTKIPKRK